MPHLVKALNVPTPPVHEPGPAWTELPRPATTGAPGRVRLLTFGHSPHFCLGANLARQELEVALGTLAERFPGLESAVPADEIPWRTGGIVGGPAVLPVRW
ncbi:hypothetical protein [Streptosporangium saharense]|uniref:hypothetical protein n=1 Tax=Streptosporangium saharense TaxID=1706840 RepID=UPI0036BAF167